MGNKQKLNMNDIKIKIVANGWILEDRYGVQFVYKDPKELVERIMLWALTIEQREKLTLGVK